MTRDEWRRAEPVLTQALLLTPDRQKQAIDSAFVEDAIRRELLEVLQRSSGLLPQMARASVVSGPLDPSDPGSLERVGPLLADGESLADGRFMVVRQLGRGGMGEVYLAHDKTLGALVALKVLFHAGPREAHHARLCSGHPHIATMHDVFETIVGERMLTVLVMEYVAGKPASRLIDDGPVAVRDAVRWTRQVAAALAHAHDRDVLHCDLKPANILITPDEGAKVLDFGIGRATFERHNPGEPLRGTAAYMAPEQLLDRRFSQAGDIYGLGVTLFELVAGRLPFEGEMPELVFQIAGAPAPHISEFRKEVPERLDEVVSRALAKDPRDRYRSARAFDRALEALEWELVTDTSPVPAPIGRIPAAPVSSGPMTYIGWVAAAGAVLTALGFVSSTALDAGLERTGPFRADGPLMWPVWGWRAMVATLALTALGAIALVIVTPLCRPFARVPWGVGAALCSLPGRLAACRTMFLAQTLLAVHVAVLGVFVWYYQPLLLGIFTFMSGGPREELAWLSPHNSALHNSYRQVMAVLLAVFGLAWYRLFRRTRSPGERDALPAVYAGGAVMAMALVLNVMPHRVIYMNRSPQVQYAGQICSEVGRDGGEALLLLFCPLDPSPNRRVALEDPALIQTDQIDNIFRPLDPRAATSVER